MLKFHRWLSVLFGVFLLWIATTGVMSQFAALQANGGFERETDVRGQRQAAALGEGVAPAASAHGDDGDEDAAQARPVAAPAAFVMTYRPKPAPNGARAWVGWLHHLHSPRSSARRGWQSRSSAGWR